MNLTEITKKTLQFLFAGYCSSGETGMFSVTETAKKYRLELHDVRSSLKVAGWIENPNFGY